MVLRCDEDSPETDGAVDPLAAEEATTGLGPAERTEAAFTLIGVADFEGRSGPEAGRVVLDGKTASEMQ